MRSKRFKPIVDFSHREERQAARALGESLQILNQNIQQLEQLITYREEYAKRFNFNGTGGLNGHQVHEQRQFIDNINQAIENQEKVIEQSKRDLEAKKKFWFSKRGKSKALDEVLDRYIREERVLAEKKEQREIDDRYRSQDSD